MKPFFKKIIVGIITFEAKLVLKKHNPKIVAITGSVGKTSTKDAVFAVLSTSKFVRKSEKSFNSDIGVPLTILGLENAWSNPVKWLYNIWTGFILIFSKAKYPEWLVLEVGADSERPTYIHDLTKWIKPDMAVFTGFAKVPVHVEFFGSREKLFKEKTHLFAALKPEGVAVISQDDEEVQKFGESIEREKVFFGFKGGDITASDYKIIKEKTGAGLMPVGISFNVEVVSKKQEVTLYGCLGRQHVYPILAAFAVGFYQGLSLEAMVAGLKDYVGPKGRMRLILGLKGSLIIDDTYNSSPLAVNEALDTLSICRRSGTSFRKIAVLGDMMELGKYSTDAHRDVGIKVAHAADYLVTVGVRAHRIAEAALDEKMDENNIYETDDALEAGRFLQNMLKKGDVVLVKGSQSMRMERTVKEIMAEPQKAGELLVRQESEWSKR